MPEFDELLLPESIRGFAADVADRMQAPIEYISSSLLEAADSIVGNRFQIAPKRHDDWKVTPNLWACMVGRPGKNKSSALHAGLEPLKKLEKAARTEYDEAERGRAFDRIEREPR